jgi:hypothetical protein
LYNLEENIEKTIMMSAFRIILTIAAMLKFQMALNHKIPKPQNHNEGFERANSQFLKVYVYGGKK